jgi:hypothetical protein
MKVNHSATPRRRHVLYRPRKAAVFVQRLKVAKTGLVKDVVQDRLIGVKAELVRSYFSSDDPDQIV